MSLPAGLARPAAELCETRAAAAKRVAARSANCEPNGLQFGGHGAVACFCKGDFWIDPNAPSAGCIRMKLCQHRGLCLHNGSCVDTLQAPYFRCKCAENFAGYRCETNVSVCIPNPCFNSGVCHAGVDETSFLCFCAAGFKGDRCEKKVVYGLNDAGYPVNALQYFFLLVVAVTLLCAAVYNSFLLLWRGIKDVFLSMFGWRFRPRRS